MVAHKAQSVERFIRAPDPVVRAILLYGPDAGLVRLRAEALAAHFAAKEKGGAEIVRLDDHDLGEEPARIEIELRTQPLFAALRVVRVSAGPRLDVPSLKQALQAPFEGVLLVEAGNLRPDAALRKLFEGAANAAALPCFASEQNLASLIDAEMRQADLRIDAETKAYLMTRLGADQALSRSELIKLAVFAAGKGAIEPDDIDAVVGDSAEIATETFAYEVSNGDTKEALHQLSRLKAAGTEPSLALAALGRHFAQLHSVASALSRGERRDQALRLLRPRPRGKREEMFLADCKRWGPERLLKAMPAIQEAIKRCRLYPELEADFAERLVLNLHRKAASR